ncbi:putative ABC transporter ATP-binding protein YxlF [bacterium HR17]|jgi:heme exporter protein A|uniref:Putative ABC transporter ATP-binding protein YxlF n=1 Tax=Candidatus Fervidibacter japonicus TaxID=2035412 RepID=A0A2H5XDZ5_9BACT|nr:putative ABC transporter ATP-binding protein YxlF [bacterium HR17]
MGVALHCDNLGKAFGRRWLFRHLSVTVSSGTCVVIVGPNGSGKTTLLRMLCGLAAPTEGAIWWHRDGLRVPPRMARRWLGAVLPDCEPYAELTAAENLQMVAALQGVPTERAAEWLERVQLRHAQHQLVGTFSSGMRLRLKLAMALVHTPVVLLLDEPTAFLDAAGRHLVGELIAAQKQRGLVVLATNDERDVAYGDRQIILGTDTAPTAD